MKQLVAWCVVLCSLVIVAAADVDPGEVFANPPQSAKVGVWWHWMGCNVTSNGITRDLEYFKRSGIGCATIFGLADVCTPWATAIPNGPTEGLIAFTPQWWSMVRFAAEEGRRLGIDVGLHNCPGYTSTGGPWITPELSMREVCCRSVKVVSTGAEQTFAVPSPEPDTRAHANFPVMNEETHMLETPCVEARRTDMRDIAVLAFPEGAVVKRADIRDVTASMKNGSATCALPAGNWVVLRVCHIPMGSFTQPNQWEAFGLECDKMSERAVRFHLDHVMGELKAQLGDLVGTGLRHILLDSYEAGTPSWTPLMREEFAKRRGYDLLPFLATFGKVTVDDEQATKKFHADFDRTIRDLYRDVLFKIMGEEVRKAGLAFACEPYTGPFDTAECGVYVDRLMTEFWNDLRRNYDNPGSLGWDGIVCPDGKPRRVIEAEAFTGSPENCQWRETPASLKPFGDYQFCRGVNKFMLHTSPLQPWGDAYKPGIVMGRWGTHFGRNQTWAESGRAWYEYLNRCQALLQWGLPAAASRFANATPGVHFGGRTRSDGKSTVCFVANLSDKTASCEVSCGVQSDAEWFDPVTGRIGQLAATASWAIPLTLAPNQSGFIVFRPGEHKPMKALVQRETPKAVLAIPGPWAVKFGDMVASFAALTDWTQNDNPGIKYFSGTAVYRASFDMDSVPPEGFLSLGNVNRHVANVRLNGKELGTVWCDPWRVSIPADTLKAKGNVLEIEVTNVWANRLIGDEQEPADCEWTVAPMPGGKYLSRFPDWFKKGQPRPSKNRHCFTTWNYFTKDSKLVPSGLLGPVEITE